MIGSKAILRTHQISTAVVELVDEASDHCYLVTPWVRLWPHLERSLEKAASRGRRLTFILRYENDSKSLLPARELNERFGAEVLLHEHLHTKLYLSGRRAIVGSMNLYDVSQSKNFELAYQVTNYSEILELRKTVLDDDLLTIKPRIRLEGCFEAERRREGQRLAQLEKELGSGGHCVTCGDKMDLDRKPEPRFVRCKACFYKAPDVDEARWWIRFCHFCGEPYDSVLIKPLHAECKTQLESYARLAR